MRVIVTGASGFLGSWACRALLAAGHEVTAVSRRAQPWRLDGAAGLIRHSSDPSEWPGLIRDRRPDTVLLLDWAGVDGASRNTAAQFDNLDRQRELIDAALAAGVGRVVGVGSQAEYGARLDRIAEGAKLAPTTAYGEAKAAAGRQLEELCEGHDVTWVWARIFSVFGPLDNEGLLLAHVADRLLAGEDVQLSSGEQAWSYLSAPDAGRALSILVSHGSGIVNVGHPDAPRLRDSIETFAHELPPTGSLLFGAEPAPGTSRLQPDTARLEALGWRPTDDTAGALRTTAAWLRGSPVRDPFSGEDLPPRPAPADGGG